MWLTFLPLSIHLFQTLFENLNHNEKRVVFIYSLIILLSLWGLLEHRTTPHQLSALICGDNVVISKTKYFMIITNGVTLNCSNYFDDVGCTFWVLLWHGTAPVAHVHPKPICIFMLCSVQWKVHLISLLLVLFRSVRSSPKNGMLIILEEDAWETFILFVSTASAIYQKESDEIFQVDRN